MEVKINVDEAMFKEILDKELSALTSEEIHEVIVHCIKEYFTKDDYANIEKLIVTQQYSRWNGQEKVVSEFTRKLIASCDYSGVQDVVDKAIETLKNKYDVLLKDLIRDMIIQSLSNSCGFRTAMENSIREYMWKEQQINN